MGKSTVHVLFPMNIALKIGVIMPNKNVSELSILPEDAELKGYRKGNPNGAS